MSLSQLAIFIIGVVLAFFGLFLVVTQYTSLFILAVGLVLIVVGVYLLLGKGVSL